ncbi:prolyl hydroxylase family protein [Gilvimarinus agarilyticus]|uniref:prolyl hydroxylase family protein n=1 Tax=Gilvimarinus agarilyticus TaxID=679259 RepID=UPI0006990439|nr:2OG-Fe(II) oxygenase [Gilvimarinus agarilyticus]
MTKTHSEIPFRCALHMKMAIYRAVFAHLSRAASTNAESLQMIHYGPAQEYAAHFDAWDPATERGERCMAKGGQRLVTCLLYLNDVGAGGATGFPELGLEVPAKRGRMLVFYNCYPGTNVRQPKSLHGGLPVLRGEKLACNFWFRERAVQPLRD